MTKQESVEKMKSLYKFSPIPTYIWQKVGEDFILTDLNDAARKQSFSKKMKVVGAKPGEIYLDDRQFPETLAHCFTEKSFTEREILCSLKSTGEIQRLSLKCGFVPPDMVLVHIEDLVNHQPSILQVPDAWKQTFDLLPDMVAIIDMEYRIVKMNKAMAKHFNITNDEIIGKLCHMCVHNTEAPPSFCPHAQLMKDNQEHSVEFYEERPDSYFRVTVSPIYNSAGEVVGSLHVARDITDRKRAELELENSNKILKQERKMFLRGPVVVFKWQNQEGWPVEYVSPNIKDMTGYSEDEFLTGKTGYLKIIFKDDLVRVSQEEVTYSQGGVENFEHQPYRITKKNGESIWVADYRIILRDESGKITHYLGYIIDITEQKRTSDVLQESEERLKIIFEYTPDGYYLNDLKGRFIDCNRAAEKISGYKREELIGKNFSNLKFLSKRQLFKANSILAENVMGKPTGPDSLTLSQKDGSQMELEISTFPVKIKGQRLVLGIARDITKRKQAEELLKESEENYRNIVELAPDSIVTLDLKGVITSCNPAVLNTTGYSREKFIGKHFSKLKILLTQNLLQYRNMLKSILAGKIPEFFEVPWIHRDGSPRVSGVHISLMKKGQKIIGIQTIAREITERKRMENELQAAKMRYQFLYNENPSMYFTLDKKGIILSVNQFGAVQLRYKVEELTGRCILTIFYGYDKKAALQFLNNCLQNQTQITHLEIQGVRKDGSILWVKGTARAVTDDYGNKQILVVCEDITARIKAQNEKEKLIQQLAEAEKLAMLGQFTAGVTHEINNPLHIILGKIFYLLDGLEHDSELRNYVIQIEKQVHRIRRLAEDVLKYAKPQTITFSPVKLNHILRLTIESLADYFTENIHIETKLESHLPVFPGDAIGLEIVFKNLILNSIESLPKKGKIVVATRMQNQELIEITIKDTGQGIPQQNLEKLFEPFFTTKRKSGGTGLGLAICQEIIKQHNGTIKVKSKLNKGTTFTIQLFTTQKL